MSKRCLGQRNVLVSKVWRQISYICVNGIDGHYIGLQSFLLHLSFNLISAWVWDTSGITMSNVHFLDHLSFQESKEKGGLRQGGIENEDLILCFDI